MQIFINLHKASADTFWNSINSSSLMEFVSDTITGVILAGIFSREIKAEAIHARVRMYSLFC